MTALFVFICFAILVLLTASLSIRYTYTAVKSVIKVNYKSLIFRLGTVGIAFALSCIALLCTVYPLAKITATTQDWLFLFISGFIFFPCLYVGVHSFVLHYYSKTLPEDLDKWLFRVVVFAVPVVLISFLFLTNAFADYLKYPLVNGLSFQDGFVSPATGSPNLAWYAICILAGAIFVYLLCDHKYYKLYGKHGMLESTFLVAFPAGIVGARLFYVIGEWDSFASQEFWHVFAIWEGGLTILGGATFGAAIGILWFMHANKKCSIWEAVDIIVPAILLAQAIGRWGNFFNCEVHGYQVLASDYWWLPKFVRYNAQFSTAGSTLTQANEGYIFLPLFFIESCLNFLGYFIIAHLFGDLLKKITRPGDLAMGYLVWYGAIRALLEPLRDTSFNMGSNSHWSWMWSLIFAFVGALAITINHVVRRLLDKKNDKYTVENNTFKKNLIASISVLVVSLALFVIAAIMVKNSEFNGEIEFDNLHNGVLILVLGLCLLTTLANTIPAMVDGYLFKRKALSNE